MLFGAKGPGCSVIRVPRAAAKGLINNTATSTADTAVIDRAIFFIAFESPLLGLTENCQWWLRGFGEIWSRFSVISPCRGSQEHTDS